MGSGEHNLVNIGAVADATAPDGAQAAGIAIDIGAEPSGSSTRRVALAAELQRVRDAVVRHLQLTYRGSLSEEDVEDLAQDALAELVRRRQGGETIRKPVAFAKRVASRGAQSMLRIERPVLSDPQGSTVANAADPRSDVERRVVARAELARAIEAAERLTPEQQVVYRSRFVDGLKPRESCRTLGLTRKQYYGRLTRAVAAVEESLAPDRFAELERELLHGLLVGSATASEARRAKRLLAADPAASAHARELLELHRGVAAALPLPAVGETADLSLFERLGAGVSDLRDRLVGLGGDPSADQLAAQLSASGAGRAAGGGVVAHLGLAGGAGKIAASCVAGGVAATICVATGVVPLPGLGRGGEESPKAAIERAEQQAGRVGPAPNPELARAASDPSAAKSPPDTETKRSGGGGSEPTSVSPAVEPSTPPVEQEFGVASAAPSPSPASAPGGAASQQDVQQEFGP